MIYEASAGVHVSGHAAAEELKVMLNLVRPKYFMPVHGEHRHLHFHAELARATGIPAENVFLLENGDILELGPDGAAIVGKVQAGMILVDGFAMGDFRDLVLRDRQHLASDGLVIVVVARSAQDGQIVGEPEVRLPRFRACGRPGRAHREGEEAGGGGARRRGDDAGLRHHRGQDPGPRRAPEVPAQGSRAAADGAARGRRGLGRGRADGSGTDQQSAGGADDRQERASAVASARPAAATGASP